MKRWIITRRERCVAFILPVPHQLAEMLYSTRCLACGAAHHQVLRPGTPLLRPQLSLQGLHRLLAQRPPGLAGAPAGGLATGEPALHSSTLPCPALHTPHTAQCTAAQCCCRRACLPVLAPSPVATSFVTSRPELTEVTQITTPHKYDLLTSQTRYARISYPPPSPPPPPPPLPPCRIHLHHLHRIHHHHLRLLHLHLEVVAALPGPSVAYF